MPSRETSKSQAGLIRKCPHIPCGLSALRCLPRGEPRKGVAGTVTTIGEGCMSFLLQPPSFPAPARALTETHQLDHSKQAYSPPQITDVIRWLCCVFPRPQVACLINSHRHTVHSAESLPAHWLIRKESPILKKHNTHVPGCGRKTDTSYPGPCRNYLLKQPGHIPGWLLTPSEKAHSPGPLYFELPRNHMERVWKQLGWHWGEKIPPPHFFLCVSVSPSLPFLFVAEENDLAPPASTS